MRKIIPFILVLLLILLGFASYMLVKLLNEPTIVDTKVVVAPKTVLDVLKKYDSEYLQEDKNRVYVKFGKELFEENGENNKKYFYDIIEDLKPFYENSTFYLIDEEKDIEISIQYNIEYEDYLIKINNIENFFDEIDGKSYVNVNKVKIVQDAPMTAKNDYLATLSMNSMYISSLEELGDGKELENGYTSYFDGIIKIRTVPTTAVRNIIFSEEYEGSITNIIDSGMSLNEIHKIAPDNAFGGMSENYLGYKEADYYFFFYNDEVSVYPYSYKSNETFELALEKYLADKDLDSFVDTLKRKWQTYDKFEYDPETKNAYILYSNRGIEIDIKNNDSRGINLYSNCYLTDEFKEYIKNGKITLKYNEDLINKVEKQRRNYN